MAKEKSEKNKWRIWLLVILVIIGVLWSFGFFDSFLTNSGEKHLKEKYEVLESFCVNNGAGVEMKSLGQRENQVTEGLIYLYEDCQKSEKYYITILEPTKECQYSFNGEIIKLWYNSIGQDNFFISEESKRIIESDTGFFIWKSNARFSYEFEMKNGISKMTDPQLRLSWAYKDYLKNGITKSTLYSIIAYEISEPLNCE
jgi:hypothetical protein